MKRKTKEYTGDDPDRLGAFKAAAALQHTTPQRALAGMLAKHIVSLYDTRYDVEDEQEIDYALAITIEDLTESLQLYDAIMNEAQNRFPAVQLVRLPVRT